MLLPFRRQTRGMLLNISQCADDTPKQSYPAQKTTSAADIENRFAVVKWGETEGGMDWSLGLVDANYYTENGQTARPHSTAQGTIFSIRGPATMEKNIHMYICMYTCVCV